MLMYHGHLQLKIIRKNMGWQLQFFDLAVCYSFFFYQHFGSFYYTVFG